MRSLQRIENLLSEVVMRIDQMPSPSSSPSSPPPSTPPTSDLDAIVTAMVQMMTTMQQTFTSAIKEMREMVIDMTQGRQALRSGELEMPLTPLDSPVIYDPDSTPLHPGIQQILEREQMEDRARALLKERSELQAQLREVEERRQHLELQDSTDTGPWNQTPEAAYPS